MNGLAFDWLPSGLILLLVIELILLVSMLVYRSIAQLLGKAEPSDFFVIFYRTFWRAMANPKLYPLPVNYDPSPPKRDEAAVVAGEGERLTEDELESIMAAGDGAEEPEAMPMPTARPVGVAAPAKPRRQAADDEDDGIGRPELSVEVEGPAEAEKLLEANAAAGRVRLAVPFAPDAGRANEVVVRRLASIFGVERHQVQIAAGHTKAHKTVLIAGVTAAVLADRLQMAGDDEERSMLDSITDEPSLAFRDE
jgi:uncharacterized protein YggU (UPF0235/DUF167 family)